MVAGVRGTSVSVTKESGVTYLSIPHSTESTAAANVTCSGGSREMSPGSILNSGGCDTLTQFSLPQMYTDTWIAENTRKDIIYLDSLSLSRAIAEVAVTDPDKMYTINSTEFFSAKRALCNNTAIWDTHTNNCLYAYADYTIGGDTILHQGNKDTLMASSSTIPIKDDGHFCSYQLW